MRVLLMSSVMMTLGGLIIAPPAVRAQNADDAGWSDCGECCPPTCCAPANRFYGSADYLFWWMKGYRVPPLVTTVQPNTNPNGAGILGQPNTVILFGDKDLGTDGRSGGLFRAGFWLDDCQNWGVEGSYFFLAQQGTHFSANSADLSSGVLSRPYIVQNTGQATIGSGPSSVSFTFPTEFVESIGFPGAAQGSVAVASTSQLWGADVNLRKNLCGDCCWRVDLLAGFRYLDLFDNLSIDERTQLTVNSPPFPAGTVASAYDSFTTRNQFYGGQLGTVAEWRSGRFSVDVRGTVALGDTQELININGAAIVTQPNGVSQAFKGDLLALQSNIGKHYGNQFSVVPEVGLNIGYRITEHIRAQVGYNFLYWSNVVRPGDQIDRTVDVRQLFAGTAPIGPPIPAPAGAPGPVVPFKTTDFWAQGVSVGIGFTW